MTSPAPETAAPRASTLKTSRGGAAGDKVFSGLALAAGIIILLVLLSNCSGSPGGGYRSSSGSFGGFSTGGGHK